MVAEFVEAGLVGLESLWLMPPNSTASHSRQHSRAMPHLGIAGLAGGVVGMIAHDQKQAIIGSAIAGGMIPLFTSKSGMGGVMMSVATSTAVGMVTQYAKHSWTQYEEQRKHASQPGQNHR